MSNSLDPDQDRHSVSPDLGPNCLLRLSAEDKSLRQQRKDLVMENHLYFDLFTLRYDLQSISFLCIRERSGSVVECLTRD